MTTQLNKLYTLISEFPEDAQAVTRLAKYIESRNGKATVLSINRLYDLANPSSQLSLAKIIQRYIDIGVLREIIRVELEGMDGNRDFNKIEDIPKTVHDYKRDLDVPVKAKDLSLYYSVEV